MSTTTLLPGAPLIPEAARDELARAVAQLEGLSLAARLGAVVGQPIEALKARLPGPVQGMIDGTVRRALSTAMGAALKSGPATNPTPIPSAWLHRGLAAASGAAGGALGLPGTLMELPVSTTLLLRQIAPSRPSMARTSRGRRSRPNASRSSPSAGGTRGTTRRRAATSPSASRWPRR
jgi:hypothetical protein